VIPLAARTARYQAWLKREPARRPLIGLLWEPDIPPLPEFLASVGPGTELRPRDFVPEMFLPYIEGCHEVEQLLDHEAITAYTPAFGMPWMEAIAGCRVVAHPGSLWAEPLFDTYADRPGFHFSADNPWLACLLQFTRAMVWASGGRYPVALPQMRGPLDVLAAMRTPAQLCLDVVDQPDQVRQALAELTTLWIEVAGAVLAVIPPFLGGWCSRMKMWAPGMAITPQNDVSTLFSPATYRKLVFDFDQQIFAAFPYHSFHMHSTEFRHIRTLLESEKLTAIQLTLDHEAGGPPFEVILEKAQEILAKKPLLLAALDTQTADLCLRRLPPAGLAMLVAVNTPEIPAELKDWLRENSG
jgi:hypothetical protein